MITKAEWNLRSIFTDLVCNIIGGIFYATGIYTFAKMADFSPGGISGLALIINYLWKSPIGITTLLLNIPLVLIGYRFVGKQFLIKTSCTIVITNFMVDVIFPFTQAYTGSSFMAALYSGICLGTGMAFFYMRGSSSGGMDFLTMTIKVTHPHFSLGMVTMITDFLVILLGWPVWGNVDAVLYGLLSSFSASIVLDKILYGIGAGRLLIIITEKGQYLANHISQITGRGSTIAKAIGSYTKTEKDVLLCACSKSQFHLISTETRKVDPEAFIMVTETNEVLGEGFIEK